MTLTCRDLVDFLMAYLDGELPDEERAEFERHLEACPPCVVYLETYQEAVRLGRDVGLAEEVSEAPEELVQAVLRARARSS